MMDLNKLQTGIIYEKILENNRLKNFFDLYFKYKDPFNINISLYSMWYFNFYDTLTDDRCGEYIFIGLNPIYEDDSAGNIYSMNLMLAQVELHVKKVIDYLNLPLCSFLKTRSSTLNLDRKEKVYIYPINCTEEQQLKYINILCNSK